MDTTALIEAIMSTRLVSYTTVGCISFLIYDSFLTFSREIETVWTGKWTITKLLYIITRYSAFAESAVLVYQISIPGDWYANCSMAFKINISLFVFGLSMGEIIMTIQTWAVWGRSRVMMFAFPLFYVAIMGGSYTATFKFMFIRDLRLIFVLMSIPAFKAYRSGGSSHLMKVVLRDGVLYYVYLFSLSLANIIVTLTLTSSLILILSLLSRMLHAILACRVVLDIHDLGRKAHSSHDMHSRDRSQGIQLSSNYRSNTTRPPEVYSHVTVSFHQSSS